MNEKIILNERKSKIAMILVLTILMQVFMLIFTGTSKVYAATNVEKENVICAQYSYMDADCAMNSQPTEIINISLSDAQAFGNAVSCPTTYWVVVYAKDGDNIKWTSNGKTGEQTSTPYSSSISAYYNLYAGDVYFFSVDPTKEVTFYISKGLKVVTSTPTYTITIPSTLAVEKSGWNNLEGGIKATGQNFSETQALSVTASSEHNWTLVSNNTTDTVGYNLASSNTSTYSSTATPATWEFSKSELETTNGTTKTLGVVVEDYSSKKSGDYEDTVTFTASVVNNAIEVTGITIDNAPTEALFVNSTGTLTATVLPNNATDKTVTWSSSDPDYVSINETTGEYEVKGTKGYGSATITATAGGKTATCTITGKVHHTSLQAGDVIRVGETIYTGETWRVDISPNTSFAPSNGAITLVEAETNGTLYYKFSRGSNGTKPNWTKFKVQDNTDGIYIISGDGSSSNKFVFGVHNK